MSIDGLEVGLAQALFEELIDARDLGGRRYAAKMLAESFRIARIDEVQKALAACCCLCAAGLPVVRQPNEDAKHEHPGSEPFEVCAAPDELLDRLATLESARPLYDPAPCVQAQRER